MGPLLTFGPAAIAGPPARSLTGAEGGTGTALRNGSCAEAASGAETVRPVPPAVASERAATDPGETPALVEHARARAEAAQRAYMMAALVAGLNPLNDPVP